MMCCGILYHVITSSIPLVSQLDFFSLGVFGIMLCAPLTEAFLLLCYYALAISNLVIVLADLIMVVSMLFRISFISISVYICILLCSYEIREILYL